MDERLSLGIDVGTQSTKALLLELATGRVVGRGAAAHTLQSVRPGQAEQDPAEWLEAVAKAIAAALEGLDASRVACVGTRGPPRVFPTHPFLASHAFCDTESHPPPGVSGQQHGMVCLDAAGAVVRPAKLWCDTESAPEAAQLSEALGRVLPAGFTATKASREPARPTAGGPRAVRQPRPPRHAARPPQFRRLPALLPGDPSALWASGSRRHASRPRRCSGSSATRRRPSRPPPRCCCRTIT